MSGVLVVLLLSMILLTSGRLESAELPIITPNAPYEDGLNSASIEGGGSALAAATQIQQESGKAVQAIWMLSGEQWVYYLPASPFTSTLGTLPAVASVLVILGDPPPAGGPARYCYPAAAGGPLRGLTIFDGCQLISYYGFPGVPTMGILGSGGPDDVLARLRQQTQAHYRPGEGKEIALAFHLIYAVAQRSPGSDGLYVARMSDKQLLPYLEIAEREDLLIVLDLQVGLSSVAAELERVRPYLENPRVHLALDPEFRMPPGTAPGTVIGSMDASEINLAQQFLQAIVEEHQLPNKILIVHQFQPSMVTNKADIGSFPNVDFVLDVDGFGGQGAKLRDYEDFVVRDGAEYGGIKLFYGYDRDLLTPLQLAQLTPVPDVIIYQ